MTIIKQKACSRSMLNIESQMNQLRANKIRVSLLWPLVLYSLIQILSPAQPPQNLKLNHPLSHSNNCNPKQLVDGDSQYQANNQQLFINQHTCSSTKSLPEILLSKLFNRGGGGGVLMTEALTQHSLYQSQQDKGIIILNSTNFNPELIQYKHPFPHIKLIEYYVSFCGFCAKFKQTYIKLAKDIHPWRNVIRASAIDLGVSSNSPIAHSWSVETVPTIRIHPPPDSLLAEKLDKQLSAWQQTLSSSDLQKYMFNEYNSSNLMLGSLHNIPQYMDKVPLLKLDLLRYIERYVHELTTQTDSLTSSKTSTLPFTWPNLKPVTEKTLMELLRNHPRPELFLIIEGQAVPTSVSDQSSSATNEPSLGLQIMMELSSSAPSKAVRYVRASENKALIEDVIVQHRKAISEQASKPILEQVELLNNLLNERNNQVGGNTILLVHIDDSHSTVKAGSSSSYAFPIMTVVSAFDIGLANLDQPSTMLESSVNHHRGYALVSRAKRQVKTMINHREKRSLFSVSGGAMLDNISNERKVELLSRYIKETYTETSEDREFVKAINGFDNENNDNHDNMGKISTTEDLQLKSVENSTKIPGKLEHTQDSLVIDHDRTIFSKVYNSVFGYPLPHEVNKSSIYDCPKYYSDMLKTIRYMLLNEIPRSAPSIEASNFTEQQEKLETVLNLITLIKVYFPLPDLASVRFIDGVQSYLLKQKSRLLVINNSQEQLQRSNKPVFDVRAFKQELKRLESEGMLLPEIHGFKHCSDYSCGLWRLFHTLTAFEYKKLSQIRQPPSTGLQQSKQQLEGSLSPKVEAITMKSASAADSNSVNSEASVLGGGSSLTPVERLVSPPSTTTSRSLTIVTPTSSHATTTDNQLSSSNNKPLTEADLPTPVLLVMRDYITTFFSCVECRERFKTETSDLSLERIRQQEPAEFSVLWLWETHNRVNKRLSVDSSTNPPDRRKIWYPSYYQCNTCYKKPPTFLASTSSSSKSQLEAITDPSTFHESIDWNRHKILLYLIEEYTRQPMDNYTKIFGYQIPNGFAFIVITCICLTLIIILRCASLYIERQRRHKATLLNGNGAHYSLELQ